MASPSSKKVIYAALIGNALIAGTKFTAAAATGSSAMLSEAIHSLVDTGNQWLLLYGIRRSTRPPDVRHPFGYGMEVYFWTFVVAILVFAVGAGVSFYEGVVKLRNPTPIADAYINYFVLGIAMAFEAAAWWIAATEFNKSRGKLGVLAAIRRSKDPTVFTVLFEDSAAMLGLIVAATGIALAQYLNMPAFDGLASIGIGLILAVTAMLLAYESKGLLIGESAHPEVRSGIMRMVDEDPRILVTNEVLTLHFAPEDVLLTLSVDFSDSLSSADVEAAISELESNIKARYPEIKRVFIEAQSGAGHRRAVSAAAEETGAPLGESGSGNG